MDSSKDLQLKFSILELLGWSNKDGVFDDGFNLVNACLASKGGTDSHELRCSQELGYDRVYFPLYQSYLLVKEELVELVYKKHRIRRDHKTRIRESLEVRVEDLLGLRVTHSIWNLTGTGTVMVLLVGMKERARHQNDDLLASSLLQELC